jgi:hypothetical protein
MGKPGDPGNSTQPLSQSQVLDVSAQARPVAKHDQSLWKGVVVSPDEFAPGRRTGFRVRRWAIGGVLAAGAAGGGLYAYSQRSGGEPASASPRAEPPPTPTPAAVATPQTAAAPTISADAAVTAAPADAAVAVATDAADAVSSAAPAAVKNASATTTKKKKTAGAKKRK